MKTPGFIVVFSTALALMLVGVFSSLLLAAGNISGYLRSRVLLHAYMDKDISAQQLAQAKDDIATALNGIAPAGQVSFNLVTRGQAAEDFKASSGEDFVAFLGSNPLRDYYEIGLLGDANTPENLELARKQIASVKGVFEVTYLRSLAQSLARNLQAGAFVLGGIALLLVLAASALVSNTVSLQLFSKRFLVRSMQLVGARPSFVLRPFVGNAARLSLISGALAIAVLLTLYYSLVRQVPDAAAFLPLPALGAVCVGILLLGLLLGMATSYLTIRRYLRLPLDKLI